MATSTLDKQDPGASDLDNGDKGGTVPLERLEADLAGLAASIAAATCTWLITLAEYDRRGGWETWGCKSCAHWLTWKCGMALRTAREHVQVARRLDSLPLVAQAFSEGRLSYCKVRAVCRIANTDNEAELVDLAVAMTGAQLERTIAGIVRADRRADDEEAFDAIAARRVVFDNNHDGTHTITLIVPTDAAAVVREAINERTDTIVEDASQPGQARSEVIEHRGGLGAVRADAAVELLTARPEADHSGEPQPFDVTLIVDSDVIATAIAPETKTTTEAKTHAEAETGLDAGVAENTQSGAAAPSSGRPTCRIGAHRVAVSTAERLCCDGIVGQAAQIQSNSGTALIDIGRRSRVVPRRLRRALEHRDNHCCQFPGCDATRRLHAHHIIWWRDGGPTSLDNLVLVCQYHHRVIHEGAWTVHSARIGIEFKDPRGRTATGRQLCANPFELPEPRDHHLGSRWAGEALDYSWISTAALHNERVNRSRRLAEVPAISS